MKKLITILMMLAGTAGAVSAQTAPLHIGTTNTLVDEFGLMLKGTDPGSTEYSLPYVEGDLVQILRVFTNQAGLYQLYPPGTNGLPTNAWNAVIHGDRVGRGLDPLLGPLGRFSTAVTTLNRNSLADPIYLVARVFNAPTLEEATFYQDSLMYNAQNDGTQKYSVFIPVFTSNATTKPVDDSDHDGDGLSRSWERSLGSDENNPDTDGDGMPDGPEVRAGTDLQNPDSLLVMVQMLPYESGPSDLLMSWDSVTGKTYQVEFTTNDLAQAPVFADINPTVTATGLVAYTVITNGLDLGATHFRVRLVE